MNGAVRTAMRGRGARGVGRVLATDFVRRLSIKWKLIAIVLLLTLFGLTIVFAGMTVNNRVMFERRLAHDMAVLADIIGSNSRAALAFNDPAAATGILAALRVKQRIVRAILYDAQGRQFAGYERAGGAGDPRPILREGETSAWRDGYFTLKRDILLDERRIGHIYLVTDLEDWAESLRNYAAVFVLLALLTVGLTLALAVFLQRLVTAPISRLAETAREVSRCRDYSTRATKTTADELGVLVDGFNEMLGEIQRRDAELLESHALLERRVTERTAQLESMNKELEAFSYSVSHDLRAPLRTIDGFSQMLQEDYSGCLDDAGQDSLRRVRAAAQRMAHLIDDLLKLSRVTRAELSLEEVDLSALAQEVVEGLQRQSSKRTVRFDIAPGLKALADPRLLHVVLENLLDNAWKFTSGRDTAHIRFGTIPREDGPAYFVRDNGAGFDMAYAGKLFGAFQRLHDAREFPGTGIGLATVQRVIHKHGGRVWAEGETGKGATFYFTL
jgi:signal transduction histidine kinase